MLVRVPPFPTGAKLLCNARPDRLATRRCCMNEIHFFSFGFFFFFFFNRFVTCSCHTDDGTLWASDSETLSLKQFVVTRPSSSRTNEPPRKIQLFLNKTPEMYIHAGATIVVTVIIKISTMHFQLNLNYYQYLTMLLLWSKRERRGQSSESGWLVFFFFLLDSIFILLSVPPTTQFIQYVQSAAHLYSTC